MSEPSRRQFLGAAAALSSLPGTGQLRTAGESEQGEENRRERIDLPCFRSDGTLKPEMVSESIYLPAMSHSYGASYLITESEQALADLEVKLRGTGPTSISLRFSLEQAENLADDLKRAVACHRRKFPQEEEDDS